ncbi:hypothetical protein LINPERHAP1_LOCUS14833 [Linum perenne]
MNQIHRRRAPTPGLLHRSTNQNPKILYFNVSFILSLSVRSLVST